MATYRKHATVAHLEMKNITSIHEGSNGKTALSLYMDKLRIMSTKKLNPKLGLKRKVKINEIIVYKLVAKNLHNLLFHEPFHFVKENFTQFIIL